MDMPVGAASTAAEVALIDANDRRHARHLARDVARRADQRKGAGAAGEALAVQPVGALVVAAGMRGLAGHVPVHRRVVSDCHRSPEPSSRTMVS